LAQFVLVHGAFDGGWIYRKVAHLLRTAGHEVFTPTLTGLGERSHLRGMTVSLDTHIQDVANVITWEGLNQVVLCGHSYAGMVIAGVAEAMPDRLAALVYLDAFIPEDGQSAMDIVDSARHPAMLKAAALLGGALIPAPTDSSCSEAADRDWVVANMTPHPLASLVQAVHLSDAQDRVPRRIAVFAEGFRLAPRFYEAFRAKPGWDCRLVPGGHTLMVDAPETVAGILLEAAA
jgi:pimeloyl-ACP methyl ester carboxylesterase